MKLKCADCSYFYADCNEQGYTHSSPYCHYYHNDGYAPCEIDDEYETPDED